MAVSTTHRQIVYRLLPQGRSNWRWLERTPEAHRQPCNAALEEREDRYRMTGRSITCIDQARSLTECRRDLPDLKANSINIQRGPLKWLDETCRAFGKDAGCTRFR